VSPHGVEPSRVGASALSIIDLCPGSFNRDGDILVEDHSGPVEVPAPAAGSWPREDIDVTSTMCRDGGDEDAKDAKACHDQSRDQGRREERSEGRIWCLRPGQGHPERVDERGDWGAVVAKHCLDLLSEGIRLRGMPDSQLVKNVGKEAPCRPSCEGNQEGKGRDQDVCRASRQCKCRLVEGILGVVNPEADIDGDVARHSLST